MVPLDQDISAIEPKRFDNGVTWTIFETPELLEACRILSSPRLGEEWLSIDQLLDRWIGAVAPSTTPMSAPSSWRTSLNRLRWSGMVESSHAEFAFEALGRPLHLGPFFEFAREFAAAPPPDDRALRISVATEVMKRIESSITLPPLRFVGLGSAPGLFRDFSDTLARIENARVEWVPVSSWIPMGDRPAKSPAFVWDGSAAVRLRGIVERWNRRPDHRVLIVGSFSKEIFTELRLAMAPMHPRLFSDRVEFAPSSSDRVDRWISTVRAQSHWPLTRRWDLSRTLNGAREAMNDDSPSVSDRLAALGLSPLEISVLEMPTADPQTSDESTPTTVIWDQPLYFATNARTLVISIRSEREKSPDELFSPSDYASLRQAGFTVIDRDDAENAGGYRADRTLRFTTEITADSRRLKTPRANLLPAPTSAAPPRSAPHQMLSASQCEMFARCPAKYFYRYRLGLRVEPSPFSRLPLVFGQALHRVLEFYFQPVDGADRSAAMTLWIRQAISEVKCVPNLSTGEISLLDRQLRQALAAVPKLEEAYAALFPAPPRRHRFEMPFEFRWNESVFCGKIDRVDLGEDGSAVLIDYKTGASTFSPEHLLKGSHFQALIYLLAAERTLKAPIAGIVFYDLRNKEVRRGLVDAGSLAPGAAKRFTRGHAVTAERFRAVVDASSLHLARVAHEIRTSNFTPHPSRENCTGCEYAAHCRHAFQWNQGAE